MFKFLLFTSSQRIEISNSISKEAQKGVFHKKSLKNAKFLATADKKARNGHFSAGKLVLMVFLMFTVLVTYQPFSNGSNITPVLGEVIEDLAFTAWTDSVAPSDGMTVNFFVDFATLYSDSIEMTIEDLNGPFTLTRTVNPAIASNPQVFTKTAGSVISDFPGVHRFKITCRQGITIKESYFDLLFHPEFFDAVPVTGIALFGSEPLNHYGDPVYSMATNGQRMNLNSTFFKDNRVWMIITGEDSLIYLKEETVCEMKYYYSVAVPDTLTEEYKQVYNFRIPTSWTQGYHDLQAVYTGSKASDLAPATTENMTINVADGFGVVLEASSNSVERNSPVQDNTLDYTLHLLGYPTGTYTLDVTVEDLASSYSEQVFVEVPVNGNQFDFSYRPGQVMNLGQYTLTADLKDARNGLLIGTDTHQFTLVDRVALDTFNLDRDKYRPGDTVNCEFYLREEDRAVVVECSTLARVLLPGSTDWLLISDQDSTSGGRVIFQWVIPENVSGAVIPLSIEAWPFPGDVLHLQAVFSKTITVVTDTIITVDRPLSIFRGEQAVIEASVYSEGGGPVTSGTVTLSDGMQSLYGVTMDGTNWDDISYKWNVSLDHPRGLQHFWLDYSGTETCNPASKEFIIAVWSRPHVEDLIFDNTSEPVYGETVQVSAKVGDETGLYDGPLLEVIFTFSDEGDLTKEPLILKGLTDGSGTAQISFNCTAPFFIESIYRLSVTVEANNAAFVAASSQGLVDYIFLTEGFVFEWDPDNIPVIGFLQDFTVKGRSNCELTLFKAELDGFKVFDRIITLDDHGFYSGDILFTVPGQYNLFLEPVDPTVQVHYSPLPVVIYDLAFLSWSIHPVDDPMELPVHGPVIDYLDLIVDQEYLLTITTDGTSYRLLLDGSISLNNAITSRPYTYRFNQKGIYTLCLITTSLDVWPLNYTCIVTVREQLELETNVPPDAYEGQEVAVNFIVSCHSEGPVRGIRLDLAVERNGTELLSFTGQTSSLGSYSVQIVNLTSGLYILKLQMTVPEGLLYEVPDDNSLPMQLLVWSSTTVEMNPFMVKQHENITLRANVKSEQGEPVSDLPVSFYYFKSGFSNSTFIGTALTGENGAAEHNWVAPAEPGDYYLSAISNASHPYAESKYTVTFKVTGVPPVITDFSVVPSGKTYLFNATVTVNASFPLASVVLLLNGTQYYLSEVTPGEWHVTFQALPGTYILVVEVKDVYSSSDRQEAIIELLYSNQTDNHFSNSGGSGTSGSGGSEPLTGNVTELLVSIVLLAGGGVLVIRRLK
ncbi:MAG: hypothetical protein ACFFD4_03990 [Candidatus Odinarchaeota archaeon]